MEIERDEVVVAGAEARPEIRVADALIDILVEQGVRVVFGIPGGTIAPLYDALLDHPEIRMVTTRHEAGAVFAAAGYAQATGNVGVALVTSGPGATNAITGLASAFCDGIPLVLLLGEVTRTNMGRRALQEGSPHFLNILGMTKSISKFSVELSTASAAPTVLRKALTTALAGPPGPVVVALPMDLSMTRIPVPSIWIEKTQTSISRAAINDVRRLLVGNRSIAIFAGSGSRHGDGPQSLLEFAERLQCPVMTTPKAKGVFPENHPLSVGVFGIGGHPSATAVLEAGVDVLVVIGSSLSELATNSWTNALVPRDAVIQIDLDAEQIGRNYPVTVGVVAPIDRFLPKLTASLPQIAIQPIFGVRYHNVAEKQFGQPGRIAPERALWEIQQVMPEDTIFTSDIGDHFVFAVHYLQITRPDGFVLMSGLASMGSGICSSLGVQIAAHSRRVAVICGDGGMAMLGTEVATAAESRLPIVFFVLNDGRLGMVENGNEQVYGRTPSFHIGSFDVAKMAEALGAKSLVVTQPNEILSAKEFLRNTDGPVVVDIRIDPTIKIASNSRFDSLAQISRKFVN